MDCTYNEFIVTIAKRCLDGSMKLMLSTVEWGLRTARDAFDVYAGMKERFTESNGYHVVVDGYYMSNGCLMYNRINESELRSMSQKERIHHVVQ